MWVWCSVRSGFEVCNVRCEMWSLIGKGLWGGQCWRVRSVVGGEGCRLQVSSCRFQVMCERWRSCVKGLWCRTIVWGATRGSPILKCVAWSLKSEFRGVREHVQKHPTPYTAYILKPYVLTLTLLLTSHAAHLALRYSHSHKQAQSIHRLLKCKMCGGTRFVWECQCEA